MTDVATPRNIGRYRIEGVLGEGAMAVVYAGFDPGIERRVAIKCLHGEVADDPGYRSRFVVEARAAGHLNHPNIVTIFDVGQTDGRLYIAMERLSGETLASRVAHEGVPPLPIVMELASQVAAALDYAHAQGVTHHDVKPENIMLSEDWHHGKLSDFGIAERHGPQDIASGKRGEIGGTPAYMAPERLRGEPADARSDLFSLGVVLYWLVTGKLPWSDSGDVRQQLKDRQRTPRPDIQPLDPATPAMLIGIVRTLLAPTPATRYQSGAEVIEDLRLAQREYERATEAPIASRIISLRVRWASALGAILCFVLLAGLAAIYAKQSTAVNGLGLDFGSSLARMVASESAENLLLADDAATRALVDDISHNQQIHYLAIADRQGHVVASTQQNEIGQALPPVDGKAYPAQPDDDIHRYRGKDPSGDGKTDMLLFDVPILYQTKAVGSLRLGVSNAPLVAAQHTTFWVIVTVLIVTLVTLVGAAYWLFRQPLALLELLGNALMRVASGDYNYRIRLDRRDELGRLFAAFNLMAGSLQNTRARPGAISAAPRAEGATQPTQLITPVVKDNAA